jgi:hypothetical protein
MVLNRDFQRDEIDYSSIDNGIVDLVRRLNEIDFVGTLTSCSGHVRDNFRDIFSKDGFCFLCPGFLEIEVLKDKKSREFIRKLKSLDFRNGVVHLDYDVYEGGYGFVLDLNHNVSVQVERSYGEHRVLEYNRFWKDLFDIANRF